MIQALIAFLVAIATAVGGLTTASTHATPKANDHAIQAVAAAGPRDDGTGVSDHTGVTETGLARALQVVTNSTARDAIQKAMDRQAGSNGTAPFAVPPVQTPPTTGKPGSVPPVAAPPVPVPPVTPGRP